MRLNRSRNKMGGTEDLPGPLAALLLTGGALTSGAFVGVLGALVLVGACAAPETVAALSPERAERRLGLMGTWLALEVEAPTRALALAASEAAVRRLEAAEARLSTWRDDSELARLNRSPVGRPFALSDPLAAELAAARRWWHLTGGAFDPAVGGLVEAWGLRTGGRVPSEADRTAALVPGGFGALELDGGTAVRTRSEVVLEEGAFGKGAGLDAALAALREAGATRAFLDLGGQVAVLGGAQRPYPWGVADPRERGAPVARLLVSSGSLATTGNGERGIEVAGERYGHVLDPRSGRPAPDFGSLTVHAADATAADCLATGLYVLGPERAIAVGRSRSDVDVLVLEPQADGRLLARATGALGAGLELLDPAVDLVRIDDEPVPSPAARAQEAQPASEQSSTQERLDRLERENEELRRRIDLVAEDVESFSLGDVIPPLGSGRPGLGPAASKVYDIEQGVSIGGYGEFLYQHSDDASDRIDALRAVLYFGYRFDEKWLLNSEIEFEHGGEETGVEFAYLDYLASRPLSVRAGLLLVPMGFVNEQHEPTTFYSALRPAVETVILPSTWREVGAGLHGELGDFVYRAYGLNGFDATGFSADEGLRDGRQKGSKALAEDFALTGRLDWMGVPGLTLGASGWLGDSGQGQVAGGDVGTAIWEGHAEWRWRGLRARGLWASARLDDVAALNSTLGLTGNQSVGDELTGWYLEAGYDVLSWLRPGDRQELTPFVRFETLDTQASVPSGFSSDPANQRDIWTVGLDWKPTQGVVVKLDWMDLEDGAGARSNRFHVALGYVF